jgi:hypothetical protein
LRRSAAPQQENAGANDTNEVHFRRLHVCPRNAGDEYSRKAGCRQSRDFVKAWMHAGAKSPDPSPVVRRSRKRCWGRP